MNFYVLRCKDFLNLIHILSGSNDGSYGINDDEDKKKTKITSRAVKVKHADILPLYQTPNI